MTLLGRRNHSRLWSWHPRDKNLREHRYKSHSCRRTTTTITIIGRKKTTRRKKKRATMLKVKMMKTTLLGATSRRMRRSMTPTRSKLLEMKPRSPMAD
jgi:hypothetical protein